MLAAVSLVPPRDAGTIPHLTIRRKFQPFLKTSDPSDPTAPGCMRFYLAKMVFFNGRNGGSMHGFRRTFEFGIRGDLVQMQNRSITR